jgi:hypothetical protein
VIDLENKMKKMNIVLLLAGFVSSFNAYSGDVCNQVFGSLHCGKGEVDVIDFRGLVLIDGTTVTRSVKVLGSTTASNARLNDTEIMGNSAFEYITATGKFNLTGSLAAEDITIYGEANINGAMAATRCKFLSDSKLIGDTALNSCIFKGNSTLIGQFKIENTQFEKNITINTRKSKFSNSRVNDIEVLAPKDGQEQLIVLSNNSLVHKITFESGRGKVMVKSHASVSSVDGGQIIRK